MTSEGPDHRDGEQGVLNQSGSEAPEKEPIAAGGELGNPKQGYPKQTRRSRLWRFFFALFALELGLFLLFYPWSDFWSLNHLPAVLLNWMPGGEATRTTYPDFNDVWDDPSFRGAVSGLGLLNLWIALREFVGVLRDRLLH